MIELKEIANNLKPLEWSKQQKFRSAVNREVLAASVFGIQNYFIAIYEIERYNISQRYYLTLSIIEDRSHYISEDIWSSNDLESLKKYAEKHRLVILNNILNPIPLTYKKKKKYRIENKLTGEFWDGFNTREEAGKKVIECLEEYNEDLKLDSIGYYFPFDFELIEYEEE